MQALPIILLVVLLILNGETLKIIPEEFTSTPIYVADGSTIRLVCSHEKVTEIGNYTWMTPMGTFADTKEMNDVDGMSVKLKEKKNTFEYMLDIASFSDENVGEYGCWPQPRYASFMYKKFSLKKMIPENVTVYVNERVSLKCNNGYGYVERMKSDWYRNGVVVSRRKNPSRVIELSGSSYLMIDNPEVNDSGTFECKVLTSYGYLTTGIYQLTVIRHKDPNSVNVEPKQDPRFINLKSSGTYEGLEVKLRCSCESCWPLTSFIWMTPLGNFSNEENLPKDFSISQSIYGRDFSYNLTIKAAEKIHEGNYTCLLENALGAFNQSVHVKLLTSMTNVGKAVAFEGYKVKLRCRIPHLQDETIWDLGDKYAKSHNITIHNVYSIFPVTHNDSGQYLCKYRKYDNYPFTYYYQRNFVEKPSAVYNLRVVSSTEELPMIVNKIQEGNKIRLRCGDNTTWTHNSHPIESVTICPTTKSLVRVPVKNSTLTVEGKFSSNGVYTCDFGTSEKFLRKKFLVLVVPRGPPTVQQEIKYYNILNVTTSNNTKDTTTITVQRDLLLCDDFITFGCKCLNNCQPLLSYNWTIPASCSTADVYESLSNDPKDDDGYTYSLKIPISSNCSGTFSCYLGNSQGSSTYYFKVRANYVNSEKNKNNICCPRKFKCKYSHYFDDEFCGGF